MARRLVPNADIRILRHKDCESIPEEANGCFLKIEQAINFLPQIAVIANPATLHVDVAQSLAQSGVHILVEKPLSASLDNVQHLLDTCKKESLVLMTGYNLRFLPSLQHFHKILNENKLGDVLSVRCEVGQYLPTWRPDTDYRQGVSSRQELGGGALLELSHEIDYLNWIFGGVEWVKANLSRQSNLEINVEDTVHMILGFNPLENGRQLIGTVNIDFIRQDATRLCTVICEKGSLRWNGLTGNVELFEAGSSAWHEIFHYQHKSDDSYFFEWRHFLECIEKQKIPLISGETGLEVLQIIDAVRESSLTGKQVFVK